MEIYVFISHGLHWALGIFMCLVVGLLYAWWYTGLTKAKPGKVYIWVLGRMWISIVWVGGNQLSAGQVTTVAFMC